jgi:hypothetical protein
VRPSHPSAMPLTLTVGFSPDPLSSRWQVQRHESRWTLGNLWRVLSLPKDGIRVI